MTKPRKVRLIPHHRTKGSQTTWALEVRPYGRMSRYHLVSMVLKMYPQLKVYRAYTVKSIKRQLLVLETNTVPYWNKQN